MELPISIFEFYGRIMIVNDDYSTSPSQLQLRAKSCTTTMPPSTRNKLNVIRRNNTWAARLRWTRISIAESLTRRSQNVNNYYFITIVRSRVFIESRQKCTQSPRAFSIAHFYCFKVTTAIPHCTFKNTYTYLLNLHVHSSTCTF